MRALLTILLPLLAPAIVYFLFMSASGRNRSGALQSVPWIWLAVAGGALMLVTLGAVALFGGVDPGVPYQAPHMENGEIAPGRFGE
jgi:hypothetical protein